MTDPGEAIDDDDDETDFSRQNHREERARVYHELRAFGVLD